jgi:phosphatidylinositol 4-kinase
MTLYQVLVKQRNRLTKYIILRSSELRTLSTSQVIFLLTMHDIESLRALEGLPSSLVTYFINDNLNKNVVLNACMEGIAEQVSDYHFLMIDLTESFRLSEVVKQP